ncbi:MAG: HDOD domain-containing protein, partial [Micromonosporaceae bacterium]|nr:HDOD domain-containing protein [Micromonosporaceae bacterium]
MARQIMRMLAAVARPAARGSGTTSLARLPLVAGLRDPCDLGAAPVLDAKGRAVVTPYAEGEVDHQLRDRLRQPGPQLVVVYGQIRSGRHRAAYEAIRAVVPDYRLFQPNAPDQLRVFIGQAPPDRDFVVWLDGWDLTSGPLISDLLTELLTEPLGRRPYQAQEGNQHRVVVIAIIDSEQYHRLVPGPTMTDPRWPALRRVARVVAGRGVEIDRRLPDPGSTQDRLRRGARPATTALIRAAVDCHRMGVRAIPESMVHAVYQQHLPAQLRERAGRWLLRGALRRARRAVGGVPSLVRTAERTYRVNERLVWGHRDRSIPDQVWQAAIEQASPADSYRIGCAAFDLHRYSVAVDAFERAARGGVEEAGFLHAVSTGETGRVDRAVTLLGDLVSSADLAVDPIHHVAGRCQIARFLGEGGDVPRAVDELTGLLGELDQRPEETDRTTGQPAGQASGQTARAGRQPPKAVEYGLGVEYALAHWRCEAGKASVTLPALREIADRYQTRLPDDMIGILAVSRTIAYWAVRTGDGALGAVRRYAELVSACASRHGAHHPRTLSAQVDLACLHGELQDATVAVRELTALMPLIESHCGARTMATLTAQRQLARWLLRAGDVERATAWYESIVDGSASTIGHDHGFTLVTRRELAGCYAQLESDGTRARTVLADVLERQRRLCGDRHPETFRTQYQLAQVRGRRDPRSRSRLVCIGRQPIYHRDGWIIGYELLFRDSSGAVSASRRDAAATSQVIVNAFTDFSVSDLAEGRLYFLNVTREFLVGTLPIPVAADWAVLEVLGSIDLDEEVTTGIRRLAAQGYQIALDATGWSPSYDRILPYVHYVKIDIRETERAAAEQIARTCREHPQIALVGLRIETPEHRALAADLGCELFQGYALARPYVVAGRVIPSSRLRHIQLLRTLADPDSAEPADLARIIMSDPGLTSRVLKMCNSAQLGLRERVASVQQAVVLLGHEQLQRWITLMDLSDLVEGDEWRLASIMDWIGLGQLVARRIGLPEETAFLVCLLTEIAELHQQPIAEIATDYPLRESILAETIKRTGLIGRVLDIVSAYKAGDVDRLLSYDISTDDLMHMYLT